MVQCSGGVTQYGEDLLLGLALSQAPAQGLVGKYRRQLGQQAKVFFCGLQGNHQCEHQVHRGVVDGVVVYAVSQLQEGAIGALKTVDPGVG